VIATATIPDEMTLLKQEIAALRKQQAC